MPYLVDTSILLRLGNGRTQDRCGAPWVLNQRVRDAIPLAERSAHRPGQRYPLQIVMDNVASEASKIAPIPSRLGIRSRLVQLSKWGGLNEAYAAEAMSIE